MICTFFHFEGQFRLEVPESGGKKGFSSALVPCGDKEKAYDMLKQELDEYGFDIIEVDEKYSIDPDKLDPASKDENTIIFVNWYEEVKRFNTTILQPFHLYDHDDDERGSSKRHSLTLYS